MQRGEQDTVLDLRGKNVSDFLQQRLRRPSEVHIPADFFPPYRMNSAPYLFTFSAPVPDGTDTFMVGHKGLKTRPERGTLRLK